MKTVCSLELDETSIELDEFRTLELEELGAVELDKPVSELDENADELDASDELDNAAELDRTEELDDIEDDDLMVISTVKVM